MQATFDNQSRLSLAGELISLRAALPVVNGIVWEEWQTAEQSRGPEGSIIVRYPGPDPVGCIFVLEVHNPAAPGDTGWLCYGVEGLADGFVLDSFGLHFSALENVRAYLRQGYQSWDGSYYVDPEASDLSGEAPHTGYAMTQLLPRYGPGMLILGFDRHDRFQLTFTFHHHRPLELTITTLWDRKDQCGLERCYSERLCFFTSQSAEGGLRDWARLVVEASPTPPRLIAERITGWCSWYNLYAAINEENILDHLEAAAQVSRQESLPMRVFQIDDGFTPEMGDWLEVKPQFPRGMKPLLDDIRAAGFIPGLWIAPFMVGNRSHLYRDHPDWVVVDRETGGPLVQYTFYGEFRWHKRSEEYYILDVTHPQAFAYLREVFHTWRHAWGCEYYKTDFMFFGSEHGPQRVVWHTPGMTRMEAWRRTATMIREEIGESLWVGCGCPLWASVGLVDGMRTGRDLGVRWEGERSALERMRDNATRNFANGILWQSDPDVVLLRERFHHLSEAEVYSLALYSGLSGGLLLTSDDLQELSKDRLRLWKFLLNLPPGRCDFPLLEWNAASFARPAGVMPGSLSGTNALGDPVLVQIVRSAPQPGTDLLLCFNASDRPVQRTYPLALLGISGTGRVIEWSPGSLSDSEAEPVEAVSLLIPPHTARLFLLRE